VVLLFILHATPEQFRAGWFVESVVSASLVVLVVRTRRPFFKSMPGKYLLAATLLVAAVTVTLPFTAIGQSLFGFSPLPISVLLLMGFVVVLYIVSAEAAKKVFYKKVRSR
jgi:Mg2+-importing ATPase